MTQKEAVYSAITSVLDDDDVDFDPGVSNTAQLLKGERRVRVINLIVQGFMSKEIQLSEEVEGMSQDEDALKVYTISLVSYWLRKDSRLNGGISYV